MTDPSELPTEEERRKLCDLFSYVLIEIRVLGWQAKSQQVADLADVFHELPREMYGWGRFNWENQRLYAQRYQNKYPDFIYNYVAMLEAIHPAT